MPISNETLGKIPKIQETSISDGAKGNIQTVEFMKKVARVRAGDPFIRKLALSILTEAGIPSNYYVSEALAIGDYVKSRVRYVRDPQGIEYLQDPLDLAKQTVSGAAQGDCDDMSLLVSTLLLSIGHSPFFRCIRHEDISGAYNHIYVVIYEKDFRGPQMRVALDCILKDKQIGYELPHRSGDEFEI